MPLFEIVVFIISISLTLFNQNTHKGQLQTIHISFLFKFSFFKKLFKFSNFFKKSFEINDTLLFRFLILLEFIIIDFKYSSSFLESQ